MPATRANFVLIGLLLIGLCGCAREKAWRQKYVANFEQGDGLAAVELLDEATQGRHRDNDALKVDAAIASLLAQQPADAVTRLASVRRRLEFLDQTDLREQTASLITDDQAVAWTGREFERRMLDNLLILASLAGHSDDAYAFASQAAEHALADRRSLSDEGTPSEPAPAVAPTAADVVTVSHSQSQSVPQRMQANALSAYLEALVHSENPMHSDVTQKAISAIGHWQPNSADGHVLQAPFGVASSKGHGVVHIISLVGRVTDWETETAAATSSALLVADQILSAAGDHSLPPTVAPVKIARPVCECSTLPGQTIATFADGNQLASRKLVDLNAAAGDSHRADRDRRIGRTVARRIIKKAAIYATKDQLSVNNDSALDALLSVGGVAWEFFEKPDTRHISLLPERIEVTQRALPVGRHEVAISTNVPQATQRTVAFDVLDGRNTVILVFRPTEQIASTLVSTDSLRRQ